MLEPFLADASISRKYQCCGQGGRRCDFDLALKQKDRLTLIETVSPQGNSASSKCVALADVPSESGARKIAAHDIDLPEEDFIILRSVAAAANPDDVCWTVAGWRSRIGPPYEAVPPTVPQSTRGIPNSPAGAKNGRYLAQSCVATTRRRRCSLGGRLRRRADDCNGSLRQEPRSRTVAGNSDSLHGERNPLATADAHGDQRFRAASPLQLV